MSRYASLPAYSVQNVWYCSGYGGGMFQASPGSAFRPQLPQNSAINTTTSTADRPRPFSPSTQRSLYSPSKGRASPQLNETPTKTEGEVTRPNTIDVNQSSIMSPLSTPRNSRRASVQSGQPVTPVSADAAHADNRV